ncbi:hypothetical protein BRE01_45990 [Brevibacillus reuszeri]|uniref:Uncharacterized protein n=1 Tax=Brevibacillus reuszeri TaxID=54915 RepID=A0ABQ0TSK0_9BACL|nr:hypothetical protein BRE01_45990 [Brevibacillus reuszeri]
MQSVDNGSTWVPFPAPLTADSTSVSVAAIFIGTIKYKLIVVGGSLAGDSNEIDVVGTIPPPPAP